MADFRTIKTAMWREDDWFMDLEADAKLFWIYLFSNPSASVAGIYRLSLRTMAAESGLSLDRVRELLAQFSEANKAHFSDGVLWVVKMREHQETSSPKVRARIVKLFQLVNHRYNDVTKLTLFATNKAPADFPGYLYSRMADRDNHLFTIGGPDLRRA